LLVGQWDTGTCWSCGRPSKDWQFRKHSQCMYERFLILRAAIPSGTMYTLNNQVLT
jgi:hypothetical protein